MAMTQPQPRPTSSFSGRLLESWGLVRAGRIRRAASELTSAARRDLTDAERVEHAALLLTCRLAVGDLPGASSAAGQLEPWLADTGPAGVLACLGHGELATALGEHERAVEHYRRVSGLRDGDDPGLAPWRSGAALALVRTGRRAEAAALGHELLDHAEQHGGTWQLAIALRTIATVDATADALTTLDRARRLARAARDLRLAAQIDADLAGLLLLVPSAETAQAVALLRNAEEYAAGEALWPLHTRITRLLDRAGERARPLAGEAIALLTRAEQRVARLAVRGLTNRQISEQLDVTVKGVEWHLSRVYRKLGIGSREDLKPLIEAPGPESAPASA
jgi:DNA-binding CsgD family transcriptional regulator